MICFCYLWCDFSHDLFCDSFISGLLWCIHATDFSDENIYKVIPNCSSATAFVFVLTLMVDFNDWSDQLHCFYGHKVGLNRGSKYGDDKLLELAGQKCHASYFSAFQTEKHVSIKKAILSMRDVREQKWKRKAWNLSTKRIQSWKLAWHLAGILRPRKWDRKKALNNCCSSILLSFLQFYNAIDWIVFCRILPLILQELVRWLEPFVLKCTYLREKQHQKKLSFRFYSGHQLLNSRREKNSFKIVCIWHWSWEPAFCRNFESCVANQKSLGETSWNGSVCSISIGLGLDFSMQIRCVVEKQRAVVRKEKTFFYWWLSTQQQNTPKDRERRRITLK